MKGKPCKIPKIRRWKFSKSFFSMMKKYFLIIFEVLKNSARDLWESHFLSLSDQYPQTCSSLKPVPPLARVSRGTASYYIFRVLRAIVDLYKCDFWNLWKISHRHRYFFLEKINFSK